jgi:hypothetical protein
MRSARLVELICGLASGAWGWLVLAFFLFGPSYTGSSGGQSCTANPSGPPACTTLPETTTHTGAFSLGLSPDAKFWISLMVIVLGAIAISAMLHSRTESVALRSMLAACTGLFFFLTCLSIASIGLLLLPSLALAIVASVAAFRVDRLVAM